MGAVYYYNKLSIFIKYTLYIYNCDFLSVCGAVGVGVVDMGGWRDGG